jgi:hypothetical protein
MATPKVLSSLKTNKELHDSVLAPETGLAIHRRGMMHFGLNEERGLILISKSMTVLYPGS